MHIGERACLRPTVIKRTVDPRAIGAGESRTMVR
ncbi:MAG: hypothetical protein RL291_1321, partial [Pseudomonadota bacterium]